MTTEKIWNDFGDKLLGYIESRVNDKETAKDILQEVFIKIHLKTSTLKDEERLSSWLYQITRNAIIDHYREKKMLSSENITQENFYEEDSSLNHLFLKCLNPFINQLPDNYRDALSKTTYDNLNQKEYAREMNLSYPAAKSRIQRARKKVKDLFINCCSLQSDKYGNIIDANTKKCSC